MAFIENITGMNPAAFSAMIPNMLVGCWQVIQIFLLTVIFSVPLGFIVALCRTSRFRVLGGIIRIYQLIVRGTPLMLQLMFCMYAPSFLFGLTPHRFAACIIAFVVNYAAYFGEIFRSGIQSIPQGQYEAGKVLGYTKSQTFFHIILPQVVKRVIPPTGSEFMVLVKDTALAQIIAQPQLFDIAIKTAAKNVSITPYVAAGVFYLVMSAVVESAFKKLEARLDYYR